ncbi:MAG TPA: hypothetical protein VML19_32090 [Verrucomicrobiae bacterium]|nr:hypothetical protein [Verrucomicrobiae bacterium]
MPFDAKQQFQKLCVNAADQVRTDQAATKTKVLGFFTNRWARFRSSNGMDACRGLVGQTVSFAISHLPMIGPTLSQFIDSALEAAAKIAANKGLNQLMDYNVKDMQASPAKVQQKGVLLFNTVAPTYLDAIRKYEEARQAAAAVQPQSGRKFKNCSEISDYLKAIYFWRYRMARLRVHHEKIMQYVTVVDTYLKQEEQGFMAFQKDLYDKGVHMFDDWQWHYANCKDICYWPEEFGQEIGLPANVLAHSTNIQGSVVRNSPGIPIQNAMLGRTIPITNPSTANPRGPLTRQNGQANLSLPQKNRLG